VLKFIPAARGEIDEADMCLKLQKKRERHLKVKNKEHRAHLSKVKYSSLKLNLMSPLMEIIEGVNIFK